jgi:hypothetical protein
MNNIKTSIPKYGDSASIIPGGTMQFLDIGIDIRKVKRLTSEYYEYEYAQSSSDLNILGLVCLTPSHDGESYVDSVTGEPWVDPISQQPVNNLEPMYSIGKDKALDPYLDKWVPLPFFRSSGSISRNENRFRYGPTDWARGKITEIKNPEENGYTHHLTIAFDTHIEKDIDVPNVDPSEGYAGIAEVDINEGAEYVFISEYKYLVWFLQLDWVKDWLKDFFEESLHKKNPKKIIRPEDMEHKFEHIARYFSFLELIRETGNIPKIRLIDPLKNQSPIDVDLVLDIGNSRTIGMLIEKREDESLSLDYGSILEIRDLSKPSRTYRDTFNSYVCFAKGKFGDLNGYSRSSGRSREAFTWPSPVRIGDEAARLSVSSKKEQGQTSSSSPKRYLWDMRPAKQEWRFSPNSDDLNLEEPPVNSGDFVGYINNNGFPLKTLSNSSNFWFGSSSEQPKFPVTEPFFCRSSLMMFLLAEIITHALVQINSPAQRNSRRLPDIPRRLRRIILTAPPAMSVTERKIYLKWANSAIDVLWDSMDWTQYSKNQSDYRSCPEIRMNLDEASATQLVFVYNEIEQKFTGDAEQYFNIFGKFRKNYPLSKSLRVASIDIGGGTTDMVITTYVNERINSTNRLVPNQEFREGFNFAGDDLLKILIENHILKELKTFISPLIIGNVNEFFHRKFSKNASGLSEQDKNIRAQFGTQVLLPISLKIMQKLEELKNDESSDFIFSMPFKSFFDLDTYPSNDILNYIENIPSILNQNIKLESWTPSFNLGEVTSSLSGAIGPYIRDLCEIIRNWNCDFLVLSGRPSSLPLIHACLHRMPPVLPSRIIPMSLYKVENWYPFWTTPDGRISDPKTTGVVGAMLSAVSEGYLKNFYFQSSSLKPASTIRFIGSMENDRQILDSNLLFDGLDVGSIRDEEISTVLKFQTQTHLGFRQMQTERWKTTPFYFLSYANALAAEKADKKAPYQISLSYKRRFDEETEDSRAENEGILKITEIVDKNGSGVSLSTIDLQLKSLWDDSHWFDSGLFDVH